MSNFIVPNTFIPGTKAKAQEVNENFSSIQNELNTKASKTGDFTQPFFVAPATEENQATTKKQVCNLIEDTKAEIASDINKNNLSLFPQSGNADENGNADLIDFSAMNLNFLVGGNYPNLVGNIQGNQTEITYVASLSLSGYSDNTYNIFVDRNGEISTFANKIYIQPKEPTMVINDIWVNTSIYPNEIKQFNGNENVKFEKLFIGNVVIKNSQIDSVYTNPYNCQNITVANHTNYATVVETYVNGSSGYRIWSDGYCEQWGLVSQWNISVGPVTVDLLKKYKSISSVMVTSSADSCYGIGKTSGQDKIIVETRGHNYTQQACVCYWRVYGYLD